VKADGSRKAGREAFFDVLMIPNAGESGH